MGRRFHAPDLFGLVLCTWLGLSATPANAQARAVDLELVLAADVSRSMDYEEAELVRLGFVQAIRHPRVIEAIQRGYHGRIAVTYMEWGGGHYQRTVVDWTEISDAASAEAFAKAVEQADVMTMRRTSISGAIGFAAQRFGQSGFKGKRRVIDVSGDGANNSGEMVVPARDRAVAKGITINGLPIINDRSQSYGYPQMPNLDLYYEDCVIGGPGSFIVVAHGFEDFARAIQQKLIIEIADLAPEKPMIIPIAERERPPCNAGEIRLRQWLEQRDWE